MAEDWNAGRRKALIYAGVRAFTISMWIVVLIAFGAALNQIGRANSAIDCKHRGYAHIDHHGGKLEDDRYHLMHHELPTCEHDKHEGKADEDEREAHKGMDDFEHDLKRAEHDLPHEHHRNKIGPHEHHHHL